MKFISILIIILSVEMLFSQDRSLIDNPDQTILRVAYNFGGPVSFYNPKRNLKGTNYLFDDWENFGVIKSKDNKDFLVRNININIDLNTIQTKISNDSIFDYDLNNIEKVTINNKVYKNIYSEKGKRIYEVIFESDEFSILKGFETKIIEGTPNPMQNRASDAIVRNKSYFLKTGVNIIAFRLTKKKILNLLNKDSVKIAKLEQYMKSENLSYNKDKDISKALLQILILDK
ncbi:MAG: hypothetical protein COS42_01775 [Flavobacteriales bacterium CG03_land_8_20_14_0_80_35_15]|nr:MAG: hypothetical protein COS42_01775 [Flavobacteriales bacterium CG03_land_8_20_14_0_80_35_15]